MFTSLARLFSLSFSLSFLVMIPPLFSIEDCRTLDWVRIENKKDLQRLQGVCEIKTSLAIFTTDIEQITLPHLKRVGLINIDSDHLKAIAFPALKSARDIYVQGMDLEVAEFPQLEQVSSRLVFDSAGVRFLNFPVLEKVGRMIIHVCPSLEFVFSDQVLQLGSIWIEKSQKLAEVCRQRILANTQIISIEEMALLQDSKRKMTVFKDLYAKGATPAPIRPTGHPTHFDSFGLIVDHYYQWYPYEYSRYWGVIGPWGYSWLYFPGR